MGDARSSRRTSLRDALARFVDPVFPAATAIAALREYPRFVATWRRYARQPGAEQLSVRDAQPQLLDRLPTTPYDPHYFHQAVWATKRILRAAPALHVDVGSDVNFVGMLSAFVPVQFVDIRPLPIAVENFSVTYGDLAGGLAFPHASIASLSCLHVAEHVGLGRYGDVLAADGTRRACAELARVLEPGGSLYFSLPVGHPRVCFNAHRIHAPTQIVRYFEGLELVEFSVVDDTYQLVLNADLDAAGTLHYGCGLFLFRRPTRSVSSGAA